MLKRWVIGCYRCGLRLIGCLMVAETILEIVRWNYAVIEFDLVEMLRNQEEILICDKSRMSNIRGR